MRRLYNAIRVLVQAVKTGKVQLIDVTGRGEDYTDKELFQSYGFASRPLAGSEGILLFIGGVDNAVVIATEDRRYRVSLESGEVALYSDEGDKVHLKRNRQMEITSGGKITIDAPEVKVNASTKAEVIAPVVNLGAAAGVKAIVNEDFITLFNGHTHGGGSAPSQQAGAGHKTTAVKAL